MPKTGLHAREQLRVVLFGQAGSEADNRLNSGSVGGAQARVV